MEDWGTPSSLRRREGGVQVSESRVADSRAWASTIPSSPKALPPKRTASARFTVRGERRRSRTQAASRMEVFPRAFGPVMKLSEGPGSYSSDSKQRNPASLMLRSSVPGVFVPRSDSCAASCGILRVRAENRRRGRRIRAVPRVRSRDRSPHPSDCGWRCRRRTGSREGRCYPSARGP